MLIFRRWMEHNRPAIADILHKRKIRGGRIDAPISLAKIIVATNLDGEFAAFAEKVGGRSAETFLIRVLQYAADHCGERGIVAAPRSHFGAAVLSRPWDIVGRVTGEVVYDALLTSTICLKWEKTSPPAVPPVSPPAVPDAADPREHQPSPSPSPSPVAPPLPPSPGGGSASPPDGNGNGPEGAKIHLRPRDRERFGTILDYVVVCGATAAEKNFALELRRRHRLGQVTDEEIREVTTGKLRWVTPAKLARWKNENRPRGGASASG